MGTYKKLHKLNDVLGLLGQKRLCEGCFEHFAMDNSPYCENCREDLEAWLAEVAKMEAKRDEEREKETITECRAKHKKGGKGGRMNGLHFG